jgi:predicted transcriptional regulator
MSEDKKPSVNFDGKEYVIEELSEEALKLVTAIHSAQELLAVHQNQLGLMQMGLNSLHSELREQLKKDEEK